MRFRSPILIFLVGIILLGGVSLVSGISLSCSECYVGDCECNTDCDLGHLTVYTGTTCSIANVYVDWEFSEGTVDWNPQEEGTYKAKIFCDSGEISGCLTISVEEAPGTTTTTSPFITTSSSATTTSPLTTHTYPPRPDRTTTTTTTTTTSTGITTTSTTSTTTTSTTLEKVTTTTTTLVCNRNWVCEPGGGENYENCPQDCPSGYGDGYCDGMIDGKCDPDCLSWEDSDCQERECGNNICESSQGEDYENCPEDCEAPVVCRDGICNWLEGENYLVCPEDCPPGKKDGYCDGKDDGECDPDCQVGKDPDCGLGFLAILLNILPYLLAFLLLILVIFFVLIRRKSPKGEGDERVKEWVRKKLKEGEDPEVLRRGLKEEGFNPGLVDESEEKLWPQQNV